jgi:hypothetical protein
MKYAETASLSATLLFPKGSASVSGFVPSRPAKRMEDGPREFVPLAQTPPRPRDPNAPVRVSMTMEPQRRNHFHLAAAKLGISPRELMAKALDHYLDSVLAAEWNGRCRCLESKGSPESQDGSSCCGTGYLPRNEPA